MPVLYLNNLNKPYEIISDIGSGINYSKKGLRELIKKIIAGQVEKIVVLYPSTAGLAGI